MVVVALPLLVAVLEVLGVLKGCSVIDTLPSRHRASSRLDRLMLLLVERDR